MPAQPASSVADSHAVHGRGGHRRPAAIGGRKRCRLASPWMRHHPGLKDCPCRSTDRLLTGIEDDVIRKLSRSLAVIQSSKRDACQDASRFAAHWKCPVRKTTGFEYRSYVRPKRPARSCSMTRGVRPVPPPFRGSSRPCKTRCFRPAIHERRTCKPVRRRRGLPDRRKLAAGWDAELKRRGAPDGRAGLALPGNAKFAGAIEGSCCDGGFSTVIGPALARFFSHRRQSNCEPRDLTIAVARNIHRRRI